MRDDVVRKLKAKPHQGLVLMHRDGPLARGPALSSLVHGGIGCGGVVVGGLS